MLSTGLLVTEIEPVQSSYCSIPVSELASEVLARMTLSQPSYHLVLVYATGFARMALRDARRLQWLKAMKENEHQAAIISSYCCFHQTQR